MSVEADLYSYLGTIAAITTLVGTYRDEPAIFDKRAPQRAGLPRLVFQEITVGAEHTLEGSADVQHPTYQLTSWGADGPAARALALAVFNALSGYSGDMGSGPTDVRRVVLVGGRSGHETPKDGGDYPPHFVQQDWEIWYRLASVPSP